MALGGGGDAKGDQPWLHKLEETLREEGKREGREEIREVAGKERGTRLGKLKKLQCVFKTKRPIQGKEIQIRVKNDAITLIGY